MTATPRAASAPAARDRPRCDAGGCPGSRVAPYRGCLAHLEPADRAAHLAGLGPGDGVDHRGTRFGDGLLAELLAALTDPGTGRPRLGTALFGEARFEGDAGFAGAVFDGEAGFSGAVFEGEADFGGARFRGVAVFGGARFGGDADFDGASFDGDVAFDIVWFGEAGFGADAWFGAARFGCFAGFDGASFAGDAWFDRAAFDRTAAFTGAVFRGDTGFDEARFGAGARFDRATFHHATTFDKAAFDDDAAFAGTAFRDETRFREAVFGADAGFGEARFGGDADFGAARFGGHAWFGDTGFHGHARFDGTVFAGAARFAGTVFGGDALFNGAAMEHTSALGPLSCAGTLDFGGAAFGAAVTVEAVAEAVSCRGTRWAATAALRLRHATVDLSDAFVEYPLSVTTRARPFARDGGGTLPEPEGTGPAVRVLSLRGVDASQLLLSDVDLSACSFAGAHWLDQLRLEGRWELSSAPRGWHRGRGLPRRWSRRQVLDEERRWRALPGRPPVARQGWGDPPADPATVPGPATLTTTYRQLRKAREDAKDEPGAADLYYGEMEMRRHSHGLHRAERWLLQAYWLLSGYGLRASRALAWLAAAVTVTLVLLMGTGLPDGPPRQEIRSVPADGRAVLVKPEAELTLPVRERFTGERFEKAFSVVLDSVVFRSSGQDLTTWGGYVERASRLTEPVLLGLALLAVRGRVKRG